MIERPLEDQGPCSFIDHVPLFRLLVQITARLVEALIPKRIEAEEVALSLVVLAEVPRHARRRLDVAAVLLVVRLFLICEPFKYGNLQEVAFRSNVLRHLITKVHLLLSAFPVSAAFTSAVDTFIEGRLLHRDADLADDEKLRLRRLMCKSSLTQTIDLGE